MIDIEFQNSGNPGNVKQIIMHKVTDLKKGTICLNDIEVQMGHMVDSVVKVQKIVM